MPVAAGLNVGAVPTCREKTIDDTLAAGKTVRSPAEPITKSAGAGVDALICRRTCSSSAVALWVVKMLATAIWPWGFPGNPRSRRALLTQACLIFLPDASRTSVVTTRT